MDGKFKTTLARDHHYNNVGNTIALAEVLDINDCRYSVRVMAVRIRIRVRVVFVLKFRLCNLFI